MEIKDAAKIIRQELLIKDEPVKAVDLLKCVGADKELITRTEGLIAHLKNPVLYRKFYGFDGEDNVADCELIEPREMIKNAKGKYQRYEWMLSEIETEHAKSYMDLACYVGSLVTSAAYRGLEATGVDMTKRIIEVAKERAASENIKCDFYCEDITTFDKKTAELVSAFEVLEHVPDPLSFVKHVASLSTKWAYMTTPNGSFDNGVGNLGHWDWDGVDIHARGHVRVFSKQSLFNLIEDAGCEVGYIEAQPDNLLWVKFRRKI